MSPPALNSAGTVCLAASPGGHLAEMRAAAEELAGFRRVWVTGPSSQADALRDGGEEVHLVPAWGRDPPGLRGLPANLRASRRALKARRPEAVVTTGSGQVVPYVLMARLAGAPVVFLESMARVTGASLSGRIVAPVARSVIVQWPETAAAYRSATVCRPVLLDAAPARRQGRGTGTFVSVGTRPEPFDRLLAMADRAVAAGVLPRPVIAQSGASGYRPASFESRSLMDPEEVERAIADARYVICHGGAGMVAAAIAAGHRPLVLPRNRAGGEHRTEHQRQITDRLAADGAVVALGDEIGPRELALADEPPPPRPAAGAPPVGATLRAELAAALAPGAVGGSRQPRG